MGRCAERPKSEAAGSQAQVPAGYIGQGEYDEATGLFDSYVRVDTGISWRRILELFPLIEQDLHDVYGIDMDADDILRKRSWRWLQARISGLINAPPIVSPDGRLVPSTRLGWAINPPGSE